MPSFRRIITFFILVQTFTIAQGWSLAFSSDVGWSLVQRGAIHKLRILKRCQNIDEFTSAIDQIYSKAKDLSVAINGAEVPLQSVLDNIDDYAVRYYYKQEGNYYSFVMQIGENANEWIDAINIGVDFVGSLAKISGIKLIPKSKSEVNSLLEYVNDSWEEN